MLKSSLPFNPALCFVTILITWLAVFSACKETLNQAQAALPPALLNPNEDGSDESDGSDEAPRFPAREEVQHQLEQGRPPPSSALFWQATANEDIEAQVVNVDGWAQQYGLTQPWDDTNWSDIGFTDFTIYEGTPDELAEFKNNIYWAFAEACSGNVTLLIPHGTAPASGDPFWVSAWPTLRENRNVEQIIWIDAGGIGTPQGLPNPNNQTNPTYWWRRGWAEPATRPP